MLECLLVAYVAPQYNLNLPPGRGLPCVIAQFVFFEQVGVTEESIGGQNPAYASCLVCVH